MVYARSYIVTNCFAMHCSHPTGLTRAQLQLLGEQVGADRNLSSQSQSRGSCHGIRQDREVMASGRIVI